MSATDVQALIEPKPVPGADILTDDGASERYSIDLELWGERLSKAGARVCRQIAAQGVTFPFKCPASQPSAP